MLKIAGVQYIPKIGILLLPPPPHLTSLSVLGQVVREVRWLVYTPVPGGRKGGVYFQPGRWLGLVPWRSRSTLTARAWEKGDSDIPPTPHPHLVDGNQGWATPFRAG